MSHHNTSTSVRELEWQHVTDWPEGIIEPFLEMVARTPFRSYQVIQQEEGGPCRASVGEYGTEFRTLEEAKAACQADFQKRITECLEPTNCEPKASGWRDIESDPPPNKTWIWVSVKGAKPHEVMWRDGRAYELSCEFCSDGNYRLVEYASQGPTHWQPLPPPPGEEDNIDTVEGIEALRAEYAHMIDALRIAGDLLLKHHQHHLDLGTVIFPATDDMPEPVEIDMTDAYSDTDLCDGTIALLKVRAALPPKEGQEEGETPADRAALTSVIAAAEEREEALRAENAELKDYAQDAFDCLNDFIEEYVKPRDLLEQDVLEIIESLRERARALKPAERSALSQEVE